MAVNNVLTAFYAIMRNKKNNCLDTSLIWRHNLGSHLHINANFLFPLKSKLSVLLQILSVAAVIGA